MDQTPTPQQPQSPTTPVVAPAQTPVVATPVVAAAPIAQPAPQSAPAPVAPVATAAAAPAPVSTPTQGTAAPVQPAAVKPGTPATGIKITTPLPKGQGTSGKKFILGCLGAFGCSLFVFIGVLFAFIMRGSTDNPIFTFLGVPPEEVVGFMITLVNFIFLFLVFISFILVVVGFFKRATAKKDDIPAKKNGTVFTLVSLGLMIFLIIIWVTAYLFLAPKRTVAVRGSPIVTDPAVTINLTAPKKITFDATKIPINTKAFEILSYNWDFGDKSTAKGDTQSHTFTELGNYKVVLTATIKDRTSGKEQEVTFSRDITINNVLANVVINAKPEKGVAPFTVEFDGSKSSSDNGELSAFAWDLDNDGEFNDGKEETASYTFEKVGTYTVKLRVTDANGENAIGEMTIEATVPDTPTAVISIEGAKDLNLTVDTPYIFSGAASTSPTGTIEKYSWDFGDATKANTRTVTHKFASGGDYDVTLTVTDSTKKRGEVTKRVHVGSAAGAPLVNIKTTPAAVENVVSGQAPFDVIFDASGSTDTNDNIVEYAWDFNGDGTTDDANALTSYVFKLPGTFKVKLKVTDATNLSTTQEVVVKVEAQGIKADIKATPVSGPAPLSVSFDATGSSYPDGSIVSYEWDFGDGAKPRIDGAKVIHQYTAIGTFAAKVTAIASDNKRATVTLPINVRPISLGACFEPSVESGVADLEVTFDPSCSTGTVVRYSWKIGTLKSTTERKPSYIFDKAGSYEVTLEVADSDNVIDRYTKTITVTAPQP